MVFGPFWLVLGWFLASSRGLRGRLSSSLWPGSSSEEVGLSLSSAPLLAGDLWVKTKKKLNSLRAFIVFFSYITFYLLPNYFFFGSFFRSSQDRF